MSASSIGAIGVIALFAMLFLRVPVWIALTLVGFVGNAIMSGLAPTFALAGTVPFDVGSAYTLSVVPLFVLMGEVASETGLSSDLFKAAKVMLAGVRGGLAVGALAASACFGAVCGSSVATAATMTRIALPEMRKAGYDAGLASGSLAAGGSLGILIPPSIILVIYAAIAEQSVPRLFAAGLVPGLALTGLYMMVAVAVANWRKSYAPASDGLPWRVRLAAIKGPWQFLALFVITIGGIYAGVFSPTEAASIGAFGAIVIGFAGRRLSISHLLRSIENTVAICGVLFVIVFGANLFSFFMVQTQLPSLLAQGAHALNLSGPAVMALIIVAYIVFGCFLEGIGMVLITVPVFLPLVKQFGYDPVWFGVIVVIVVEVGLIHPPVGLNLFVIQAHAPDIKITSIYRGIVPFLLAPLVLIVLMFLFPQIALWLPRALYG
ncbi:MAG TPA: TRAP transporter large permease [Pseudolabrys sp.]